MGKALRVRRRNVLSSLRERKYENPSCFASWSHAGKAKSKSWTGARPSLFDGEFVGGGGVVERRGSGRRRGIWAGWGNRENAGTGKSKPEIRNWKN